MTIARRWRMLELAEDATAWLALTDAVDEFRKAWCDRDAKPERVVKCYRELERAHDGVNRR